MLFFLSLIIYHSGAAPTTPIVFTNIDNQKYNDVYRYDVSMTEGSKYLVEIACTGGSHSLERFPFTNMFDGNKSSWWESGGNIGSKPINVSFTFSQPLEIGRIIFLDTRNGFPLHFKVYGTSGEESAAKLLLEQEYSSKTSEYFIIEFEKATYKTLTLEYLKSDFHHAVIDEIAFYKEDKFLEESNAIFTDGTWSELTDVSKYSIFKNIYKNHPDSETYQKIVSTADQVYANPSIKDTVFVLQQREPARNGSTLHGQSFHSGVPTGYYVTSNETIYVFCETYNNVNRPVITFNKYLDKNGDFIKEYSLSKGYNKVVVQNMIDRNLSVGYIAYMSFKASYLNGDFAPKCRFVGGKRFPFYHQGVTNLDDYVAELREWGTKKQCNYSEFYFHPEENNYPDLTIMMNKDNVLVNTVTGAMEALKRNEADGKTFDDTLNIWQLLVDRYAEYDGFDDNDESNIHHRRTGLLHSIIIAQAGKPFAWSDGFFTGYNAGARTEGICTGANNGWSYGMYHYESIFHGGWGFYHEWGHSYDNSQVVVSETTNNMYSAMMQRIDTPFSGWRIYTDDLFKRIMTKTLNITFDVGHQLGLLRQVEMFVGTKHFHSTYMRWLRENKFVNQSQFKHQLARWVTGASLCFNYNFATLLDIYYVNYTIDKELVKSVTKNLRPIPNTLKLYHDRFELYEKGKFPQLPNNVKAIIKHSTIVDNVQKIVIGLEGIENEWDYLMGYEVKTVEGEIIDYVHTSSLTILKGESAEYVITPITLDIQRLKPIRVKFDNQMTKLPKDKWNVTIYPYGMQLNSNGKDNFEPKNLLDNDPSTCLFYNKYDDPLKSVGFILDLGETTKFNGFSLHNSYDSSFGDGVNYSIYYSNDNSTWKEIPQGTNNTNALGQSKTSKNERLQINFEEYSGRYIKFLKNDLDNTNQNYAKFCDFNLYAFVKSPEVVQDPTEKDYIDYIEYTQNYPPPPDPTPGPIPKPTLTPLPTPPRASQSPLATITPLVTPSVSPLATKTLLATSEETEKEPKPTDIPLDDVPIVKPEDKEQKPLGDIIEDSTINITESINKEPNQDSNQQYVYEVKSEKNVTISFIDEGSKDFYLKPTNNNNIIINETQSEFGVILNDKTTSTIIVNQEELNMNIIGKGELNIKTDQDLDTIKIGEVTIDNGEFINLNIGKETELKMMKLNMYGKSKFNTFNDHTVSVETIILNQGASSEITNVQVSKEITISHGATMNVENVYFDSSSKMNILFDDLFKRSISIQSKGLFSSPRSIIVKYSKIIDETSEPYKYLEGGEEENGKKMVLAASEKFDECEAWASRVEFDSTTTYNSAKCFKELTLTKLYVYKDESASNKKDTMSPALLGGIVAAVVIIIITIVIIIIVVIIKKRSKRVSSSSEGKRNVYATDGTVF
ncbi:hypothetical protein TRFO_06893 [Tritrichomonas foetus]|uniref:Peptidase M60 domain-containing protein n=1 Tax=Tritrichomonas foetus TaxID=1144522 RepID=A0A1J4JUN7_9EUKA|nr:hypothetical protein TRFO_06893 [Tritrichomonas foetus]|eukprot:OHT02857.1 hypothetical protein TRFO_06893 [Tritrichomonas foetus]